MQCLPVTRTWPRQKCDRCAKYNYACSPSLTANQERKSRQPSRPTGALIPAPSNQDSLEALMRLNGAPSSSEIQPGKQTDGSFIKPKCAVYFDTLMKANWTSFGNPESISDIPNIIGGLFKWAIAFEARQLHQSLSIRLAAVEIGRDYTKFFQQAISDGMDEPSSREFASRKMIHGTGQVPNADDMIRNMDKTICFALTWKHLVDTVGVPEVALIRREDGYEEELDGTTSMPVPDFDSVKNGEYVPLLVKLLDPALGLKETCLKLSGVVGMIQRLKDLKEPDLRTFLAQEITRRVKDVLGSPEEEEEEEEEDDDDESMPDAEVNRDADVASFDGWKGSIDFSQI
ncbi:hypothetical protein BJY00DRAFT_287756 [Aspergillus carlsbadensis]|nr:hypothetical protein BJY00DRAFT_287756 [Aspergillus carlsbadensis]